MSRLTHPLTLALALVLVLGGCGNDPATSNSGPPAASTAAATASAASDIPAMPADCPHPGDNHAPANGAAAQRDPRAPVQTRGDGTRVFGRVGSLQGTTALTEVLGTPSRFSGQTIRTQGVVRQVCQRMGCWMELAVDTGTQRVFVRMAGHSFLLPRDVVGHRAVAEGRVALRQMSPNEVAHYRSEGATMPPDAMSVELEATTIEVLPAAAQPSG